jgi:UDP-N-acetylmuramate--alanine ligase
MNGRIHLVGIRGAGMSALAMWYRSLGWEVSGCDRDPGEPGDLPGITVYRGHSPSHLENQDAVVFTAAMPGGSPELEEARRRGIRLLRRSEALAELTGDCTTLAVAGAHGKTSTTSMTGWILQEAGMNPTVFLGGTMEAWKGNFRPGGKLAVVEADEYDRAFLRLRPSHAAVTAFDLEHLECYGSPEALEWAFQVFLEQVLPGGTVAVPVEKTGLAVHAARIGRRTVTCGPSGDYYMEPLGGSGWGIDYNFTGRRGRLPVPGVHNLRNAAVAVALAEAAGLDPLRAAEALDCWPGVRRRLERIGSPGGKLVISDYAHHPGEIEAAIKAVAEAVKGPVDVVFQPHLFSRTAMFHREMARALTAADAAWILPVYPSREEPVAGVDSGLIIDEFPDRFRAVSREEIPSVVRGSKARAVVFMGAGTVDEMARETVRELS